MNAIELKKALDEILKSHSVGKLIVDLILRQYYVVAEFTEEDAIRNARLFLEHETLELTATGAVL